MAHRGGARGTVLVAVQGPVTRSVPFRGSLTRGHGMLESVVRQRMGSTLLDEVPLHLCSRHRQAKFQ